MSAFSRSALMLSTYSLQLILIYGWTYLLKQSTSSARLYIIVKDKEPNDKRIHNSHGLWKQSILQSVGHFMNPRVNAQRSPPINNFGWHIIATVNYVFFNLNYFPYDGHVFAGHQFYKTPDDSLHQTGVESTDQEMIPARSVMNAHAQDFVANDELPLSIPSAFAQCTCSLLGTRNAWCFRSLCDSITVCRSSNSNPIGPLIASSRPRSPR
jgi:hypothetical protein